MLNSRSNMIAPALAELPDRDVVKHVLTGSHAEFEILVRRHNQRLFRAARGIVRSDTEAEDVVQQTWLDVFRNLHQFRGDAAFTTWATRICIHAAIAHARKRPVVGEIVDIEGGLAPEPSQEPSPAASVERAELGSTLESCLARLPQASREVMVLRDVLELDTAETAACLGVSEEVVRVRLHRARAAVAAELMQRLDGVYSFDGARCDRVTGNVMQAIALYRR
jgi:RNA polymerase sigma-70 factor, ECF subfamily